MSRNIAPFGLRMPPEMKAQLEFDAHRNGRSLNAEIVQRLISRDEVRRLQAIEERLNKLDSMDEKLDTLLYRLFGYKK